MLCKRYHKKKIQLQKKLVKKVLATLISSVYNDVFFQLETNYKNYATFAARSVYWLYRPTWEG